MPVRGGRVVDNRDVNARELLSLATVLMRNLVGAAKYAYDRDKTKPDVIEATVYTDSVYDVKDRKNLASIIAVIQPRKEDAIHLDGELVLIMDRAYDGITSFILRTWVESFVYDVASVRVPDDALAWRDEEVPIVMRYYQSNCYNLLVC